MAALRAAEGVYFSKILRGVFSKISKVYPYSLCSQHLQMTILTFYLMRNHKISFIFVITIVDLVGIDVYMSNVIADDCKTYFDFDEILNRESSIETNTQMNNFFLKELLFLFIVI